MRGNMAESMHMVYINHKIKLQTILTKVSTKIQSYLLLSYVPQIALFSSLEEQNHPNS